MRSAEHHKMLKNWGYVIAQFALIGACLWGIRSDLSNAQELLRLLVVTVLFLGAGALGVWSLWSMGSNTFSVLPAPVTSGSLCERGPYRWLCHPMYSAVLLICLSAWVLNPTLLRSVAWVLLVAVLIGKLRFEERLLQQRFSGYKHYQQARHRLVPYIY